MNSLRLSFRVGAKWTPTALAEARSGCRNRSVKLARCYTSANGKEQLTLFRYSRSQIHEGELLSIRSLRRTCKRGFRVKGDKTEVSEQIKAEPHEARSQPQAKSESLRQPQRSLVSFALKTGACTVGFSAVVFGGSALWQQENMRRRREEFWNQSPMNQRQQKGGGVRDNFNNIWNHLSFGHKVMYGIMAANLLIWGAWKLGNPQIMEAWFTLKQFPLQSSVSRISHHFSNMFLSMFSHKGFIHLYINMYVLSSFAGAWNHMSHSMVGDSNLNSPERFLSFYLTAGMASSFLSSFVKVVGSIPQPSLGASGAILGLIGYICEKLPNNLLSIAFIPNWTFSAGSAKNFIIAFDIVGLLIGAVTGWKYVLFDHAGHLGGMLFGMWYAKNGERLFNKYCEYVANLSRKK